MVISKWTKVLVSEQSLVSRLDDQYNFWFELDALGLSIN